MKIQVKYIPSAYALGTQDGITYTVFPPKYYFNQLMAEIRSNNAKFKRIQEGK